MTALATAAPRVPCEPAATQPQPPPPPVPLAPGEEGAAGGGPVGTSAARTFTVALGGVAERVGDGDDVGDASARACGVRAVHGDGRAGEVRRD